MYCCEFLFFSLFIFFVLVVSFYLYLLFLNKKVVSEVLSWIFVLIVLICVLKDLGL